ncbi:hypothetical protein VTK26DRAFT_9019 [Humicola hyalothermophila]
MPPEPILRLRNCVVRPYHEDDAEGIAKVANNPNIAKWLRNHFPSPYTVDDARKWIKVATTEDPTRDFAICEPDGSTFVGSIGLKMRDDVHYRTMELGYFLSEDHWGRGIITEATVAFADWAFNRFDHLIRLEAQVIDGNGASARVLEKAGFELESRQKKATEKGGVIRDLLIYTKFRPE